MSIVSLIEKTNSICDIGTDHGNLPIYLIENNLCNVVYATDINDKPYKRAKLNIESHGLSEKILVFKGSGFNPIINFQVNACIIAGMGGNLICDIISENYDYTKKFEYLILQAPQNPEVLRKFLYENEFTIIDENICIEDGIFYETIKVIPMGKREFLNPFLYEFSRVLSNKNEEIFNKFLMFKLTSYKDILCKISGNSIKSNLKRNEIYDKIKCLENILKLEKQK